jgi:hypothetical protein
MLPLLLPLIDAADGELMLCHGELDLILFI